MCALCGASNPSEAGYCSQCGVALGLACSRCGASNNPRALRCGGCGVSLREEKPSQSGVRAPRESRRIVTILFADIVGYTSLVETLGEQTEAVRAALKDCFDALGAAILDHGGIVEKFIGDAICALFGAPLVREDDPRRALACALEMQTIIARLNAARPESDPVGSLSLRIGISTGEVVGGTAQHAGQEQYSVTGDAVNTASRLQTSAEPGEILVGVATERLVRDAFVLESVGAIKLKGKRAPVEAFLLVRERDDVLASSGPVFVDRKRELEQLSYYLRLASEGDPQLVELVGDAGVGKSRLVEAFSDSAVDEALVCRGSCPPQAATPLFPFRAITEGLLKGLTQERREEMPSDALAVFEAVVDGTLGPETAEHSEAVVSALHMAIRAASLAGPIVMVVENFHRSDAETLDVLQRLVARIRDERLLLLWTRRTGEEIMLQGDYSASFTRMPLRPLSERDAEQLMRQLLGDVNVPETVQRLIVDRSGGNLLYIEAMVRTIIDDGGVLDGNEPESLEVPTTVTGLIQARLDSLPESRRLVVQEAAVAGREFDARLLQIVDLFGLDVLPELEALARNGMIEHVAGSTYRFRHLLTQEVCYETMLQGLRSELHREIADIMPEMYPDQSVELAPTRADHYAKAGDTDRAVEVLVEAGGAPS